MKWSNIIISTVGVLISLTTSCLPIQAQNTQNNSNSQASSNNSGSKPSEGDRGANRKPASDRGECPIVNSVNSTLTALVPEQNAVLTISDSPTLLFYVPYNSHPPLQAEFSLQDENDSNVIEPIPITLSNTPGIISINLPKILIKDKFYRWSLAIICKAKDNSNNPGVDGWIKLVSPSPSLANQLKRQISPIELSNLYKQEGLVVDALVVLAKTRYQNHETDKAWQSLLQSLDLQELSSEKIVQ